MHVVFIPYGEKFSVDRLLMDMQSQKFVLPMKDREGNEKKIWITGAVRLLPFGVYEYVFPREALELVLSTLNFNISDERYTIPKVYLKILQKVLRIKDAPKFNSGNKLLWTMDDTAIIPLGIREDVDFWQFASDGKEYFYEAL